ncbi:MAG TPA: DUF4423 domain-containing protein [Polyangiales bacterium]|nr:DUF4423 domain-containing protein [Polyangiales bacterium]
MRDYVQLSRELLRALRGRRSQAQLSRRLGYASNVVFDWESGRRAPTAASALLLARRTGVDVAHVLQTFLRSPARARGKLETPRGVRDLMLEMRGNLQIAELARAIGCSRFAVSRWLQGSTQPKLPDFLAFVEHSTLRLLDFLAAFVDVEALPSVRAQWRELSLARQLAYDVPWSHAVLRALELEEYRSLQRHVPGWIAGRLGIAEAEERRCLELLERSGQIQRERGRLSVAETRTVDTRSDPARSRELRAFWARVGTDRFAAGAEGEFAFNLFGVSSADLERIRQLQRAFFSELRSIVARSEPTEQVVLLNLQLLPLS